MASVVMVLSGYGDGAVLLDCGCILNQKYVSTVHHTSGTPWPHLTIGDEYAFEHPLPAPVPMPVPPPVKDEESGP